MPSSHRHSQSGQASADYVALIALVAVVLGGAGVAIAGAPIVSSITHAARVAICIVGGDVCRTADARALGLEPCVVNHATAEKRFGLTVVSTFRARDLWIYERRSDGSVAYTAADGRDGGASFGIGAKLARGIDLNVGITPYIDHRWGKTWVFPDEHAAAGFVKLAEVAKHDANSSRLPPPTWSFRRLAGGSDASADVAGQVAAGAAFGLAAGRRKGPNGTTWTFDADAVAPHLLDGLAGGGDAKAALEYTVDPRGRPSRLSVVRTWTPPKSGRAVESSAVLDLSDPANRAAVQSALSGVPPFRGDAMKGLAARWRAHAVRQRLTYEVQRASEGPDLSVTVGVKVGFQNVSEHVLRRLVAAEVVHPGGRTTQRADCLAGADRDPR